jgi:polar amino acid transport system permease protein
VKRLLFSDRSQPYRHSLTARIFNCALIILLIAFVFWLAFSQLNIRWNWSSVYSYRHQFITGWWMTIGISLASLGLSTCIGLIFALGQRSRFLPLRYLSRFYVEIIRGTPLLVQILIFWYVICGAAHFENRFAAGVLALSIFSGAYITEIIRAGIESIGKSQLESARAIGLTRAQTYRHVVLPQALRQTLPPLAGQFVSLIKDSSLLSVIAISEFTLNAQEIASMTYSNFECYLPLAAGYLVLTFPISMLTRWLEARMKYET